jgi:hypothetical protein
MDRATAESFEGAIAEVLPLVRGAQIAAIASTLVAGMLASDRYRSDIVETLADEAVELARQIVARANAVAVQR